MINPSTFIIILTSAFSQSLAQTTMSPQQLLVQTSDFTFSMDQEPITINYIADIEEFTPDQIIQLKTSVRAIARANKYDSAVDDTVSPPKDLVLKTLYQKLVFLNQHFTKTLEFHNAYLNSRRDTKREFAAKDFACIMSQKLYQKNITDTLFKEIGEYSKMSLTLTKSELTNINNEKYKKAKTTIGSVLSHLTEASKDFDELFDRMYNLLENNLPPLFYTHLKQRNNCDLDGQTIITNVSCHLHEQQIGCILLGLQLKNIQTLDSYFFVPIHGHTLALSEYSV